MGIAVTSVKTVLSCVGADGTETPGCWVHETSVLTANTDKQKRPGAFTPPVYTFHRRFHTSFVTGPLPGPREVDGQRMTLKRLLGQRSPHKHNALADKFDELFGGAIGWRVAAKSRQFQISGLFRRGAGLEDSPRWPPRHCSCIGLFRTARVNSACSPTGDERPRRAAFAVWRSIS